eukprot:TRINITY_DN8243_c0_g1_i9.p2 TRINITY_DN8243_c0_g1~~TRINITY_DN8243_c0_g1_i9.p2  ORF type:complete len:104 (+),score=22.28 TRINITY_DN8243_c0_g1_i9:119-430(+)
MSDNEPVHEFIADINYLEDSDDFPQSNAFPLDNETDIHAALVPPPSLLRMSSVVSNTVVLDPIMEATYKEEAGSLDSGGSQKWQYGMRSPCTCLLYTSPSPRD